MAETVYVQRVDGDIVGVFSGSNENATEELTMEDAEVLAFLAPPVIADYEIERQLRYPKLSDQLDMQYWDIVNETTIWQDAIAQIKSDVPTSFTYPE